MSASARSVGRWQSTSEGRRRARPDGSPAQLPNGHKSSIKPPKIGLPADAKTIPTAAPPFVPALDGYSCVL